MVRFKVVEKGGIIDLTATDSETGQAITLHLPKNEASALGWSLVGVAMGVEDADEDTVSERYPRGVSWETGL